MASRQSIITVGDDKFVCEECCTCGIQYFIPKSFFDEAMRIRNRNEKRSLSIHCPRGHEWHYLTEAEMAAKAKAESAAKPAEKKDLRDWFGSKPEGDLIDSLIGREETKDKA